MYAIRSYYAGIHIDQYSTNNTILNNNIRTYGIDASAIELQHLSTNDLILNNIISTITGYGVLENRKHKARSQADGSILFV